MWMVPKTMFVIRTGIHKMLVRIANRQDPDQTASVRLLLKKQSDLGLCCVSGCVWQATSVQNCRTSSVLKKNMCVLIRVFIT